MDVTVPDVLLPQLPIPVLQHEVRCSAAGGARRSQSGTWVASATTFWRLFWRFRASFGLASAVMRSGDGSPREPRSLCFPGRSGRSSRKMLCFSRRNGVGAGRRVRSHRPRPLFGGQEHRRFPGLPLPPFHHRREVDVLFVVLSRQSCFACRPGPTHAVLHRMHLCARLFLGSRNVFSFFPQSDCFSDGGEVVPATCRRS